MSLHSGGSVTTEGSSTQADQISAACATGAWAQCGGTVGAVAFSGDPCCPEGNTCSKRTEEFSQCVPDCQCAPHSNRLPPLCPTRHTAHPLITLPAPLIAPPHRSQDGALGPVRWDRVRREQVLPVRRQLHRAEPRLFAVRASEAARRYRGHVWCVVRPGPRFRRHVHHGPVDAVRRQVLHGRQLLPEGVLVHLPHRGLLAMRALTRTRRFMSSRQWSGPPSRRTGLHLAALWSVCLETLYRVLLS